MRELAHVSLHLEDNGKAAFLDGLDVKASSRMEKEADEMAGNALIPAELWASSGARENPTPMAVYELSQRAEVHMAVAAGRVRSEHNDYGLLSQSVGWGAGVCVRGSELRRRDRGRDEVSRGGAAGVCSLRVCKRRGAAISCMPPAASRDSGNVLLLALSLENSDSNAK